MTLAPFEWIAALRFMREGLAQTSLIVSGVALGVGVIVFMSALLAGLQQNVVRRTLNFQAPIVVLPPELSARALRADEPTAITARVQPRSQQLRSINQWQRARDDIARLPGVLAVAPIVSGPGLALRGDANKAVTMTGIEPSSYFEVIAIREKIVAGRADLRSGEIIIGVELASDLGASVGDKIRITTAAGGSETLTVCGLFDFGNKGANERNVYVPLRSAQNLLDLSGGVSALEVKVQDPFAAEAIAQAIRTETGLRAESWITTNAQFFTAMAAQTLANTLIRFFVGLTAALGIASVLVVSVVQRQRDIGILRAMGTSRNQVLRLFLIQGAVMAFAGSLIGSTLGYAFLLAWRRLALAPDGTPMFIVVIEPKLFVLAALGATIVGLIAASAPARRAARLDPVVAIRA
jgi:lipoprotein-releasing system permease protein